MAVTIKLKNSVTQDAVPTTTHLPAVGELALNANINSLGIYMRASDNSIVKMAGPGSVSTVAASTTVAGISEYATNAETTTGTSTTRSVTPAGLKAVTDAERTTSNSTYLAKAGGTLTGVVAATAGSNSAPSIHFGDSDSGIYGGTNTVSLAAGGIQGLTLDSSAYVNIPTRLGVGGTPSDHLHISANVPVIRLTDTDTSGYGRILLSDTSLYLEADSGNGGSGNLIFRNGGTTERARIDNSGRLLVASSTSRTIWGANPKVQIESTDSNTAFTLIRNEANNAGPWIALAKSRGASNGSHTIVQDGDSLGSINWFGADGVDLAGTSGEIRVEVDGTPGSNDLPGRLVFKTTADGANAPTTRLTISSAGHLTATKNIKTGDDAELILGEGNDLRLWHDQTDSFIKNYTGDLYIQADGDDLIMRAADDIRLYAQTSDIAIECIGDGGVKLYYNGGSVKAETTSSGFSVPGGYYLEVPHDSGKLTLGAGTDLEIFHNGTDSWVKNVTGKLRLCNTNGNGSEVKIGAREDQDSIIVYPLGATEIYHNGSKKLETTADGAKLSGHLTFSNSTQSKIVLDTADGSDSKWLNINGGGDASQTRGGGIMLGGNEYTSNEGRVWLLAGNSGSANGTIDFSTGGSLRATITHDGHFKIPNDSGKIKLGTSADFQLYHDGSDSWIRDTGTGMLRIDGSQIQFRKYGTSEILANFIQDSACELYYNNAKTLETTADGITIGGDSGVTGNWQLETYNGSGNCGNVFAGTTGAYLYIQDTGSSEKIGILANGRASITSYKADDPLVLSTTDSNGTSDRLIIEGDGDIRIPQDSKKLFFGAENDLEIYHDGSNNNIKAINGHLNVYLGAGKSFSVGNSDFTEDIFRATENGAVSLYYDSSKKLETTANGITVSGQAQIDGACFPYSDDNSDLGLSSNRWDVVYAANGTIQTSDKNEKNTIVESDLGLNFVNKLKPVSYKWNKDDSKTHYGLIAQDVEETLSTEGKTDKDFAALNIPTDGPIGLNYSELISPLIKAIQELSAEVETLKTKIAALGG